MILIYILVGLVTCSSVYVNPGLGSDVSGEGTLASPYKTLGQALNVSNTIKICGDFDDDSLAFTIRDRTVVIEEYCKSTFFVSDGGWNVFNSSLEMTSLELHFSPSPSSVECFAQFIDSVFQVSQVNVSGFHDFSKSAFWIFGSHLFVGSVFVKDLVLMEEESNLFEFDDSIALFDSLAFDNVSAEYATSQLIDAEANSQVNITSLEYSTSVNGSSIASFYLSTVFLFELNVHDSMVIGNMFSLQYSSIVIAKGEVKDSFVNGDVISGSSSNMKLSDMVFHSVSHDEGHFIQLDSGSLNLFNVRMDDSESKLTFVEVTHTVLTIVDCTFSNLTCLRETLISANAAHGAVVNSTLFQDCRPGFQISYSDPFLFENCTFIRVVSVRSLLEPTISVIGSVFQIVSSNFINCTSFKEGGAVASLSSELLAINTDWAGCQSEVSGGAVFVRGGTASFKGCRFDGNSCRSEGGAITVANGHLSVEETSFVDNVCAMFACKGGAVHVIGSCDFQTFVSIVGSIFSGNSGNNADGGHFYGTQTTVNIFNTSFVYGGKFSEGDHSQRELIPSLGSVCLRVATFEITESRFENNVQKFGSLAADECGGSLSNCSFVENTGDVGTLALLTGDYTVFGSVFDHNHLRADEMGAITTSDIYLQGTHSFSAKSCLFVRTDSAEVFLYSRGCPSCIIEDTIVSMVESAQFAGMSTTGSTVVFRNVQMGSPVRLYGSDSSFSFYDCDFVQGLDLDWVLESLVSLVFEHSQPQVQTMELPKQVNQCKCLKFVNQPILVTGTVHSSTLLIESSSMVANGANFLSSTVELVEGFCLLNDSMFSDALISMQNSWSNATNTRAGEQRSFIFSSSILDEVAFHSFEIHGFEILPYAFFENSSYILDPYGGIVSFNLLNMYSEAKLPEIIIRDADGIDNVAQNCEIETCAFPVSTVKCNVSAGVGKSEILSKIDHFSSPQDPSIRLLFGEPRLIGTNSQPSPNGISYIEISVEGFPMDDFASFVQISASRLTQVVRCLNITIPSKRIVGCYLEPGAGRNFDLAATFGKGSVNEFSTNSIKVNYMAPNLTSVYPSMLNPSEANTIFINGDYFGPIGGSSIFVKTSLNDEIYSCTHLDAGLVSCVIYGFGLNMGLELLVNGQPSINALEVSFASPSVGDVVIEGELVLLMASNISRDALNDDVAMCLFYKRCRFGHSCSSSSYLDYVSESSISFLRCPHPSHGWTSCLKNFNCLFTADTGLFSITNFGADVLNDRGSFDLSRDSLGFSNVISLSGELYRAIINWPLVLIGACLVIVLIGVIIVSPLVAIVIKVSYDHFVSLRKMRRAFDQIELHENPILSSKTHNWHIPLSKIRFLNKLGSGAYGQVLRGIYQNSPVAIKRMPYDNAQKAELFAREAALLARLRHPNVLLFYGANIGKSEVILVTQLCEKGDLQKFIRSNERIDDSVKMSMLRGAASAMMYLHEQNPPIIHRDLKPSNILLETNWNVRIGDLGLAKAIKDSKQQTMTALGDPSHLAPECLLGHYGLKADVFSFSIVAWELFTRRSPYPESLNPVAIMHQVSKGVRPDINAPGIPDVMKSFIVAGWNQDPDKRPSFARIVDWFNHIKPEIQDRNDPRVLGKKDFLLT